MQRLAGDGFDAELETRGRIDRDKAGGEFETVVLSIAVRVHGRRGVGIVLAEVCDLPVVVDLVTGVAAKIIRADIHDREAEEASESLIAALHGGGGVLKNRAGAGEAAVGDARDGTGDDVPSDFAAGEDSRGVIIDCRGGRELACRAFVDGGR